MSVGERSAGESLCWATQIMAWLNYLADLDNVTFSTRWAGDRKQSVQKNTNHNLLAEEQRRALLEKEHGQGAIPPKVDIVACVWRLSFKTVCSPSLAVHYPS